MHRLARPAPYAALLMIAIAFSWAHWTAQPVWTPDALFYEAQVRELTGTPAAAARADVFFGPLGRSAEDASRRVTDAAWIEYSAPFYRRRWIVPALGAGLEPAFGSRALELVSLLGYVLSGLFVFALARRRFGTIVAFGAAAFTLWFPPLRLWAGHPLTDTMGVAALALALFAAHRALEGPWTRLVPWAASVVALAFTRDIAAIVVFAALWAAVALRTRRSLLVAATGLLAALPAPVLFGTPIRKTLAFTFSGNRIPDATSWHFIVSRYGSSLSSMVRVDFPLARHLPAAAVLVTLLALVAWRPRSVRLAAARRAGLGMIVAALAAFALLIAPLQLPAVPELVPAGLLLLAAVVPLFLPAPGDALVTLARGGAAGAVGWLFVLPQYTGLRLALVVLPFAALGVARAAELAGYGKVRDVSGKRSAGRSSLSAQLFASAQLSPTPTSTASGGSRS